MSAASAVRAVAARAPELLRERSFRRYWTGQTVSQLGDQVTFLVLPLSEVLILHADAAQMGWLSMAAVLPALLFSLVAGAWVDGRGRRRQVMIAADLARAVLMASVPLAYAFGRLTMVQLYAVAFAVGTLGVVFAVSNAALFVSLVAPEQYVEGKSLTNGSSAFSFMAGPSVGGLLVQVLAAPFALLVDAVSYVVSALLLGRITPAEPPAARRGKGQLLVGLRYLARSRSLRALLLAAATVNFFNYIFHALVLLYAVRQLGLNAGTLGVVLGAGAIGGVLGAVFAGRLVRVLGVGRTVLLGYFGFPAPLVLVPLAGGPKVVILAAFFAAEFLSGVGVMLLDIASGSLQAALTPNALRSRISGAWQTVNYGMRPLGALTGGLLGSTLGLRPTLWLATVGGVLCVLWLLPSPVPRMHALPPKAQDPVTDPDPSPAPAAVPAGP
ncbi:Predicted arabinose efflux permease, MFS family [Actinacidiphila yanglinensis]|uniref:Predicted arabinose efflux permease, MFS family n=1 Tax=Actinacidiphila yanglinensis TaxID=310779 RepID=A0A1H6DNB8_9ACTN|nr:MFS transporter [Actinacidiphila yanglinensis]SEG86243.1 Predicted arabinose efflux permease, MFS family [Actinacidiphila yanglinensis]